MFNFIFLPRQGSGLYKPLRIETFKKEKFKTFPKCNQKHDDLEVD